MGDKLIRSYLQIAQLITHFSNKSKIFYLSFDVRFKGGIAKSNYEAKLFY